MGFLNKVRESRKKGYLKGSLHITIPVSVIEAYNIKKDDIIELDLIRVVKK